MRPFVDDDFAILFDESPDIRVRQKIEHFLDGRQSLTPLGVTTIGRLIRIGFAIMKSSSSSSDHFGSPRPNSA